MPDVTPAILENPARVLRLLGQPMRLHILLGIGADEVCVCHLEALTGLRQAAISQHLMGLRKAGLVLARRSGRFICYRLSRPEVLALVLHALELDGQDAAALLERTRARLPGCRCSRCAPQ